MDLHCENGEDKMIEKIEVGRKEHLATIQEVLKDMKEIMSGEMGVDPKCPISCDYCGDCGELLECMYKRYRETTPESGAIVFYDSEYGEKHDDT